MNEKMTIRTMPQEDHAPRGHGACAGCGVAIAVKNVMRILGADTTVYVPACCLLVFGGGMYPISAFDVPFFYTAFENTGAVISGIKAGLRKQGKDLTVVGIAGDGGTFDIGLQALSGAAERNEDVHLRLRGQRGVHEHRHAALRLHALRGLDHHHAGGHEDQGQARVQEGPDVRRRRAGHSLRCHAVDSAHQRLRQKVEKAKNNEGLPLPAHHDAVHLRLEDRSVRHRTTWHVWRWRPACGRCTR